MRNTILAPLVALTTLQIPLLAQAADGQVDITGAVQGGTCAYEAEGGSQNVAMPPVGAAQLAQAEQASNVTPFDIRLTGCGDAARRVGLSLDGTAGNADPVTGRLRNAALAGHATNVQVAVVDRRDDAVNLRLPGAQVIVDSIPAGSGDTDVGVAVIPLGLRYVATGGPATAGSVTTAMSFSIVYE